MRRKASTTYWSVVDPMVVPHSPALAQAMADNRAVTFPVGPDGAVAGLRWFLGTRWHEADIYAELIKKGWPALVRQATQPDGSSLWPSYWTTEKLAAKKLDLGSAIFNLQYQNDPSGMGGNIFKRDWFHYVDRVPDGARRVGMDLNASAKERSDYTAATEWVEDSEHNLYLVGAWRKRLDEGHPQAGQPDSEQQDGPRLLWPTDALPPGWVGQYIMRPATRPLSALNIEATIFQSTFTREVLGRTRLPAMAVFPDKDKVTRARTLAARYEAGKVFHLHGAPGLDDYEMEAVGFPNGEHDDLVDAAVYGADLNAAVSEFYWTKGNR
jgi:phage terminase large subunit-like protein